MTDNYDNAGVETQPTGNNPYQLSIDELPKHDNGYPSKLPSVMYFDEAGFLPEPKPESKHWYQSKTIWFNAIVVAVGLATSATPALEQYMSAEVYGVIASFVAFINAVLRLATGQPIKQGGA